LPEGSPLVEYSDDLDGSEGKGIREMMLGFEATTLSKLLGAQAGDRHPTRALSRVSDCGSSRVVNPPQISVPGQISVVTDASA